jgi:hypothetical protein
MTFAIRPLKWRCVQDSAHHNGEFWHAATVFGDMYVTCEDGGYIWGHFDEWASDEESPCASIEAGMQAAEAYYLERLLPALEAKP